MRTIKSLALTTCVALIVVFAVNALTASTALALPEFLKGGVAVGAGIKFNTSTNAAIKATLKGPEYTVTCMTGSGSGETLSATEVEIKMKYKECSSSGLLGGECTTAGNKWIETSVLEGTLIYLEKGAKKAGLWLEPKVKTDQFFSDFYCGLFVEPFIIYGTVIGELKGTKLELEAPSESLTVPFEEKVGGGQKWARREEKGGEETLYEKVLEPDCGRKKYTFIVTETIGWLPAGTKIEVKS